MIKKIFAFLLFVFIAQNALAEYTCNTNVYDYYAIYKPLEYTCQSGYYLPANTDGCIACPDGFICNGGTFSFDSNLSQGLSYINNTIPNTSLTNMCADNFPIDLYAVYAQNETITVNFINGDSSETVTCTYGDDLTIPEPPTRVGYTFTGWKVKND